MTKQVDVGLFFGESFYEVIFIERPSDSIVFSGTFFNSKDPFKTKFPKIIQSLNSNDQSIKIDSVFVSYRYLERIFKFKLGGSVAQVVTKGFESWLALHQYNRKESLFSLKAPPDLSSHDMIFTVNEKIDSDGNIQTALTSADLNSLAFDLKKKEAKRVCLSLVNSEKNPQHRDQIKKFLEENQFEVFDALELGSVSDFPSWRACLIEASLAGTYNEMKSEITEVLSSFAEPGTIYFIPNKQAIKTSRNILSGLFALEDSFFNYAKTKFPLPDQFDVIHIGLENFSVWLNVDVFWHSPWGITSLKTKKRIDLKVQPTNSFHLNAFEEVEINHTEESFEPGPMCLGRGKIPCIYDLLNSESTAPELQKKIQDSFWALARSGSNKYSAEKAFEEFKTLIWDRILIEASLATASETIVLYGTFSRGLEDRVKEIFNSKNLVFISQKDFPKAWLALLGGRSWVQ